MSRPAQFKAEGEQPLPGPHPRRPDEVPAKTRLHALDAIRGAAMFLVVAFHAGLAYTHNDIPQLLWVVRDPAPHLGFDLFCVWAMGVSNPLFFTIAGFFAAHLYQARGPVGFLANRTQRIVAPLAAGILLILPLELLVWAHGWYRSGRCNWHEFRHMQFHEPAISSELPGTGHLWFLHYLIPMLLAYWVVQRAIAGRVGDSRLEARLDRMMLSPWKPLALALPTALLVGLSRQPDGLDAVFDRHNSFGFELVRLLHHGFFFAVGAWIYRVRGELDVFGRQGLAYLGLSAVVFAARFALVQADWTDHDLGAGALAASAALAGLFGWLTVLGVIGTFQRFLSEPQPVFRYLADASYWVYLVHMPVLGLAQTDLFRAALPAGLKYILVLAGTITFGLATYHAFVRYTLIGRWLHGERRRPGAGAGAGEEMRHGRREAGAQPVRL